MLPKVKSVEPLGGRPFEEAPRIRQTGPDSGAANTETLRPSAIAGAEKTMGWLIGFNPGSERQSDLEYYSVMKKKKILLFLTS